MHDEQTGDKTGQQGGAPNAPETNEIESSGPQSGVGVHDGDSADQHIDVGASAGDGPLAGLDSQSTDANADAGSQAKPSRWSADEALTAINAGLKAELEEAKSQVRYLAADLENTRKRSEREKADMARFAIAKFAEDILPIADTIQRAMALVPAEALANDEAMQRFVDGVMMIEGNLLATLERHGVVKLNPLGEKFDPNRHQAVMEDAHPEIPKGHVSMVHQAGYMISDRVLRTAMVTVSNGAGQTAAAAPAPASGSAPAAPSDPVTGGSQHPQAANDDEAPTSRADQGKSDPDQV